MVAIENTYSYRWMLKRSEVLRDLQPLGCERMKLGKIRFLGLFFRLGEHNRNIVKQCWLSEFENQFTLFHYALSDGNFSEIIQYLFIQNHNSMLIVVCFALSSDFITLFRHTILLNYYKIIFMQHILQTHHHCQRRIFLSAFVKSYSKRILSLTITTL